MSTNQSERLRCRYHGTVHWTNGAGAFRQGAWAYWKFISWNSGRMSAFVHALRYVVVGSSGQFVSSDSRASYLIERKHGQTRIHKRA